MTWRQEQAQKEYAKAGLPNMVGQDHFERYMTAWAEQNKAMLEDRQKETKEEN